MNIKQTFSFFIILLMLFPSVASAPSTVEDGFTGYYEVTSTLSSGENITLPAGAERVDVSVADGVEYSEIVEVDASTYPNAANITRLYPLNGDVNDYSGNAQHGTNSGSVLTESGAVFNGTNHISFPSLSLSPSASALLIDLTPDLAVPDAYGTYLGIIGNNNKYCSYMVLYSNRNLAIESSTDTVYLINGGGVVPESTRIQIMLVNDNHNHTLYYDKVFKKTENSNADLMLSRLSPHSEVPMNGTIHRVVSWNSGTFTQSDVNCLYYGFSGIQISNLPYHPDTTLELPAGTETVTYIATDDTDREVTVRAYYSNDIEVEETKTDTEITILINHTASTTTDVGYIEYEPINYPVYHLDMSTDNPNASFTYSSGLINISTGYITGDTDYQYILTGYDRYDYTKYSISGNVFDADTLEPIGNISVTLDGYAATTNTTGYYLIDGIYNGTYTISFVSEDYTLKYQPVTISGTNITDLDIYLNEDTNQKVIPLMMFYMLIGLFVFLVLMTFRGIREDGVYIDNLIFGAFLVIQSFYMSKIIINGTVVEMSTFITDTNTVITHTTPVVSSSLGTFFEFFGIVTVFALIYMLYSFIQERKLIEDEWN